MSFPDPKKYYAFEVHGGEWGYVLHRLIRRTVGDTPAFSEAVVSFANGIPIYFLSKKKFTPEVIARAIGVSPEEVRGKEQFKLTPLEGSDVFKQANVTYWGEA